MKVLVFNVKYSANLGDGLLAQCLEGELMRGSDELTVETIDLAGRSAFGESNNARRRLFLRALQTLPSFLRRAAVSRGLAGKLGNLRDRWQALIDDADAVVIGGGNLFQDDDLNFPLKVATVLDCVRRSAKPLAIYAVGVGRQWSPRADELFRRLELARVVHVSVRDRIAARNWAQHFPAGPHAEIVPDPGLLAIDLLARHYGREPARTMTIGVCVTDPLILHRHATHGRSTIPFRGRGEYQELIKLLLDDGYNVRLFSNGAEEDQAFARRLLGAPDLARCVAQDRLSLAPRPTRPEELVDTIAAMQVIMAHRLHACIAAYSLGVPQIGLAWDEKVEGFFSFTGQPDRFAAGDMPVRQMAVALAEAARQGIDPTARDEIVSQARSGVRGLETALLGAQPVKTAGGSIIQRHDRRAALTASASLRP
ncbi:MULTISPECIES: polysaccharide pyruvyl transferase family protein [Sinorhizobium]|uniref:polysaccharide pyruvyl transferase family protein n=1 Tax=Sinorhizobium TaxID=28105 RepID=UPI000BEAAE5F|nr:MULTISPECIES: polysaccharide pyruvyl transferase family protein [Sinorhizobium]PDT53038.1 hypothetical protein CO664_11915 [Sinorhizobium sp. NG07B]POH29205.1 hypothetical protein ATY30_16390 [Sinorhizobium americanum]